MSETENERAPSLVRSFLEPSPTLPFVLFRKKEGGGVEEFPVRCRLLRLDQTIDVLEAADLFRQNTKAKSNVDIYKQEQAVEAIQRAICRPEPKVRDGRTHYSPYFVDATQVRASLTAAECAQMLNFISITERYYNTARTVEPEDVEKMVDALTDELAGPYFLSQWDSADWPVLIYTLAGMVQEAWAELGRTPSDLQSSSESDLSNSGSGTIGFTELPGAQLNDGSNKPLPTDRIMTREEARAFVQEQAKRKPEPED